MTDPKLTPREPSEAERLAQALTDWKSREVRDLDRLDAAAELRRLAALSESNAIDALNYESRIERLQAENDALRAMHDAAPSVEAEPVPNYSEMSREQLERHTVRLAQASQNALDFWHKHALGPLMSPSCLCCGKLPEEVAIQHLELPGVVICKACRDATHPAAPQPAALPELSDAEIGRLVDRMDNTHDSDLLKFARAVIAAMKGKQ